MTAPRPPSLTTPPAGYADWLAELKTRIHSAQQRAALAVNRELVLLYWQIGRDILSRQSQQGWGAKVVDRLAHDLRTAFPDMKGFSRANLMYARAFAEAWPDEAIVQQLVGHLPWGHNLVLLTKLKGHDLPAHYGPFLRLLVDAAAGDRPIGDAERQRLVGLAVEVVDSIVAELTVNFWRPNRQPAQDALGSRIFEILMASRLPPTAQIEALVDKLMALARANHAGLLK